MGGKGTRGATGSARGGLGTEGVPNKFLNGGWEDLPDDAGTWEPIEHSSGSEGLIKESRLAQKKRIAELVKQLEDTKAKKRAHPSKMLLAAKLDGKTKGLQCKLCGVDSEELA
ncbi:hypothetical protein CYMTET_39937 [Cymbomonas tetramitiformis]|uniref:Uncharacterized protein n=1 Tax=Cymbomonas tetramitiformis TaxID=36881 RepID=A0AAE0CA63_9CHLO|nr:hypothetical protein CYMTET_39938 [Cymbomonas tetramitiformis]KAK3250694.1 hypothetical protein CYMTET_39937 [Cymbomonas tetramitiformis]